jgi:hypothetical protein
MPFLYLSHTLPILSSYTRHTLLIHCPYTPHTLLILYPCLYYAFGILYPGIRLVLPRSLTHTSTILNPPKITWHILRLILIQLIKFFRYFWYNITPSFFILYWRYRCCIYSWFCLLTWSLIPDHFVCLFVIIKYGFTTIFLIRIKGEFSKIN